MNRRTQQFKVGLFVIVTIVLLIGLLFFVMQTRLGNRKEPYYIYFEENVKGLGVGSPVNFQGINVGSVMDARFNRGRTEVEIGIDTKRAEIQQGTTAQIDRAWVTGQATVELEGYDPEGKPLPPLGVIHAKQSVTARVTATLPEVMEQASHLLEDLKRSSESLRTMMSDDNAVLVSALLADGHRTVLAFHGQVEKLGAEASRTLVATSKVMENDVPRLTGVLEKSGETLNALTGAAKRFELVLGDPTAGGSISDLVVDLRRTASLLNESTAELRVLLNGNQDGIRRGLMQLAAALQELRDLARDLRSSPSSLVFGRESRERRIPDAAPTSGSR